MKEDISESSFSPYHCGQEMYTEGSFHMVGVWVATCTICGAIYNCEFIGYEKEGEED
jgi:hypothetical protein